MITADPPHRAIRHLETAVADLVSEEPVAELGVIDMGVEEPNRDPLPDDDSATTCYDEVVSVIWAELEGFTDGEGQSRVW